jgi:hypothetical protein
MNRIDYKHHTQSYIVDGLYPNNTVFDICAKTIGSSSSHSKMET